MSKKKAVSTFVSLVAVIVIELILGAPMFNNNSSETTLISDTVFSQIAVAIVDTDNSLDELHTETQSQHTVMSTAPTPDAFSESQTITDDSLVEDTYELHEFISLSPASSPPESIPGDQVNLAIITETDVERLTQTATTPETLEPLLDVAMDAELQHRVFNEVCNGDPMRFCLIMAIAESESGFDPSQVGDGGESLGIVQINRQWHLERIQRLGITDLLDPIQCMRVGINYLDDLMTDLQISVPTHRLLMAYNMGPVGAREAYANGNYSSVYSRTVLPRYEAMMSELAMQGYIVD